MLQLMAGDIDGSGNGDGDDRIYDVVEVNPEFPGGNTALLQWLNQNIRYPRAALDANLEGRVFVRFVVEKDGSISNTEIARSVDPVFNSEALRLVNSMPKWTPGKQNGQPVRCRFVLPITFKIV